METKWNKFAVANLAVFIVLFIVGLILGAFKY